jgi:predicted small lipoprotein YifL
MGKIWATLGLMGLLAGCGGGVGPAYTPPTKKVTVQVTNTGTESASGEAKDWDGHASQTFTVAPGDTMTCQIEVSYRLKVHIVRPSDNLVLLDDFWDEVDISHDELSLAVSP